MNHVGIAVRSIEKALEFYRDRFGLKLAKIEEVPHEGVRVAILPVGEVRIELLEPLNESSPLRKFLKKHGEGVHHIAFNTSALEQDLQKLSGKGIMSLGKPRQGAENTLITFLHPKDTHGVLIELCQLRG